MKQFLILAAMPLALGACESKWEREGGLTGSGSNAVQPSGKRVVRNYDLKDFTAVQLVGPDDVAVVHGADFAVRAEGDSAVLDLLEIKVSGNELQISRKSGYSVRNGGDVKVTVTLPKLTAISSTGSGDMDVDRGEGDFDAELTGAGDIRIGTLAAGQAKLSLTGAGDISVGGGSAQSLKASILGPGNIDAAGFTASSASVSITGPGDVRATVKGPAAVSIMGPGNAELGGGAQCTVNRLGPGEARCS